MTNLRITEIRAFAPSKDFERSKHFYKDLDFTMASKGGGVAKYGVSLTPLETQPWTMRDFCLSDPSGVLWRIGPHID